MMRVARLACLIVIAVLPCAAPAAAQAPAVDQYTNSGSSAQTNSGSSAGTAPGGVASDRASGSEGNGDGAGSASRGSASRGSASQGSGAQVPGSASTGATTPAALELSFGTVSGKLAREIDAALLQAGIQPSIIGHLTKRAVERFLDSALADQLSDGDAEDVGRAVADLVVNPGPLTPAVLEALFGHLPPVGAATHAVFTRSHAPKGDYADFQTGVVEGSSDVPRAYAELSTTKPSFVAAFDALGVSTVDDIDTSAGKDALVAILVSGAEGNFGSKATADAKLVDGEVKPLSATTGNGVADGKTGYALLALVVVAVLWSALGLRPRRRRHA